MNFTEVTEKKDYVSKNFIDMKNEIFGHSNFCYRLKFYRETLDQLLNVITPLKQIMTNFNEKIALYSSLFILKFNCFRSSKKFNHFRLTIKFYVYGLWFWRNSVIQNRVWHYDSCKNERQLGLIARLNIKRQWGCAEIQTEYLKTPTKQSIQTNLRPLVICMILTVIPEIKLI